MNVLVDLALFAVIAVIPTVVFLALWRGIEYLGDDELVEAYRNGRRPGREFEGPRVGSAGAGADEAGVDEASVDADDRVACLRCGTPNLAGMTYCKQCQAELPDDG